VIGRLDLLPQSCREAFLKRRARRRWIVAYVGVLALVVVGHSGASMVFDRVDTRRDALREKVEDRLYQNEEASALLAEIRELEGRLTRYNDLAWPVRMSEVIGSIGGVTPEGATLTALTLSPRTDRVRIPAQNGKPASERVEHRLMVEMQGVAVDDLTVARVVSGLDESPLFASVSVDFTRQRNIDGVDAREFRLQAEIDLDTRYTFVDARSAEGEWGGGS